jgi:hypothetical protein
MEYCETYLQDMVVQTVKVLFGTGSQVDHGIVDPFDCQTIYLSAIDAVAHTDSNGLHGLAQVLLIFFQVGRLSIQLL